jgi:Ca2+/H+ antiporter
MHTTYLTLVCDPAATATALQIQATAMHHSVLAAGAGIINMSHEVYYIVAAVAGTCFLILGLIRGLREHHKRGAGSALSAILGGVLIAIVVAHLVGLYSRGNQEFDDLDHGGHSSNLPSGNRGW